MDKGNLLQPSSASTRNVKTVGQGCGFRASSGSLLEGQIVVVDNVKVIVSLKENLHNMRMKEDTKDEFEAVVDK